MYVPRTREVAVVPLFQTSNVHNIFGQDIQFFCLDAFARLDLDFAVDVAAQEIALKFVEPDRSQSRDDLA